MRTRTDKQTDREEHFPQTKDLVSRLIYILLENVPAATYYIYIAYFQPKLCVFVSVLVLDRQILQ